MISLKFTNSPDKEIIGTWKTFAKKVLIGSSKTCNIIIEDDKISKVHLCLELKKDGLIIHGLSEKAQYFSNGKKIFGTKLHTTGDKVRFGDTEFEIIKIEQISHDTYSEKMKDAYESSSSDSPEVEKVLKYIEKELLWLEKEINAYEK